MVQHHLSSSKDCWRAGMSRWSTLIDLEHETAYFGSLIDQEASDELIEKEFDRLSLMYFGYTRKELKEQVPLVVLGGFEEWYYEEIIELGARHGYDFADKASNKEIGFTENGFFVISQWMYFAEMLIAKECGFFPTTTDEIVKVKLDRDAKKFQNELLRQRQRPSEYDQERERVFGPSSIREGTIITPKTKHKPSIGREIKVEVIRRRSSGPLQSPRR